MEIEKENPLKTIKDLENLNFYIPNYQRGYRWGKIEVNALLQDILDFYQTDRNKESFYCLQPIVVKKDFKRYKVIDGQQRLTTIFLIIKFLNNKDIFDINYQTRRESNDFLKNIHNKLDSKRVNIDFFYFLNAYKEIKKFFNDKMEEISKEEFLQTLLYSCKVLWYEISEQEKENEVFIRLNIGKIPLLEAENIKALFLAENEYIEEDELKERAEAWYEAEIKAREDNDFRYCVLNKINEKNLMYNEFGKPVIKDDILRVESYLKAIVPSNEKLFDYFYKYYKDKTIDKKWEEFISSVNTLESFSFKGVGKIDREIFHSIGYLILSGENIFDIYQFWLKNKDKNKFKEILFNRIKSKISNYIQNIDELHYGKDRDKIINILLLFNLEYLISQEDSNEYFKFNRFQLEQWSLEHIYAQNSRSIEDEIKKNDNEKVKKWLIEVKEYLDNNEEAYQNIEAALKNNEFNKDLFNAIDESFINDPLLNSIQNLTLLDKSSNSRIGNHIFSKKRKEIQKLGEEDKLIPIATKKVFNKEFSNSKDNPDVFTKKDQEDYLENIKKYLNKYN